MYEEGFLTLQLDIHENEKAVEASRVFVKEMNVFAWRRRVDSWAMPAGLFLVQTIFVNIIHYFGNYIQVWDITWHLLARTSQAKIRYMERVFLRQRCEKSSWSSRCSVKKSQLITRQFHILLWVRITSCMNNGQQERFRVILWVSGLL